MEAVSPLYAALGVAEFEALNDLACWLDGLCDPKRPAEPAADQASRTARSAVGEG